MKDRRRGKEAGVIVTVQFVRPPSVFALHHKKVGRVGIGIASLIGVNNKPAS